MVLRITFRKEYITIKIRKPTQKHLPPSINVSILFITNITDAETGIDRETQLKKWSRSKKDALISKLILSGDF